MFLTSYLYVYNVTSRKYEKVILTFPIARRPLSKKSNIPRKRNNIPNPVTPIPISKNRRIYIIIKRETKPDSYSK